MGNYHSLQIFKYEHSGANVEKEYRSRIENPTVTVTNLVIDSEINGEHSGKKYPLFLMPIPEILKLQGIIEQNSRSIIEITNTLPNIASNQFFNKTLVDEIMSTNEIEGVKTHNKEVVDAINNAENKKKNRIRLQSFAKMYLRIKNRKNLNIQTLEDIRKVYDYLLDGEIPNKKLPDGILFRNRYARIGTDLETVHLPKMTEQEISISLKDWITFINNDDVPAILKSFIAHYFFENIHPFNDGNGRVGRYIACVYLGYKLDALSAITFSSEINKNKEKYYKAFEEVSTPINHGEITFFVSNMMKIFIKGQKRLIKEMEKNKNSLEFLQSTFSNNKKLSEIAKNLLYLYSQAFLFNDSGFGLEDRELKAYTKDYYWTTVKKCIEDLTEKEILAKTKNKPITRRISSKYISKITHD